MAHRGRLNVLAHTVGRPYATILVEFEGEQTLSKDTAAPEGGTGDVKYHYGASGTYRTRGGRSLTVTMSPNPSHLEYVNPVIEGRARADQTTRKARELTHDPNAVLPVLIHGDAAFPGQGMVAETLNLQALRGLLDRRHDPPDRQQPARLHHRSGRGALHALRVGPRQGLRHPDHPRERRRRGGLHQRRAPGPRLPAGLRPRRADRPDRLPPLRPQRDRRAGLHAAADVRAHQGAPAGAQALRRAPRRARAWCPPRRREQIEDSAYQEVAEAHTELKESMAGPPDTGQHELDRTMSREPRTTVAEDTLRSLNEQLLRVPDGFEVHRKLKPFLERRRSAFAEPDGRLDWAHAEALAFASLLALGVPVRLTGQDSERGTFSQRHAVLHDAKTGERWCPLQDAARRQRALRAAQPPAVRAGLPGLRVRLQRAGARRARAVGGPVRRLRELGAGDRRPVHGLRAWPSGARPRGSRCCCRTATRARGPSTRARGSSASSRAPPRATSGWPTSPRPRSTSTCCAARRWCPSRAR